MDLRIPTTVFARLMPACAVEGKDTLQDNYGNGIFGINVSRDTDGNCVAVATNTQIMAIEYLGKSEGSAGNVTFAITNDQFAMSPLLYPNGFIVYSENMVFIEDNAIPVEFINDALLNDIYPDWRKLTIAQVSEKSATKNNGGTLSFERGLIDRLLATAPSQAVTFPHHFGKSEPVIARDPAYENWCGIFRPLYIKGEGKGFKNYPHAVLPTWLMQ